MVQVKLGYCYGTVTGLVSNGFGGYVAVAHLGKPGVLEAVELVLFVKSQCRAHFAPVVAHYLGARWCGAGRHPVGKQEQVAGLAQDSELERKAHDLVRYGNDLLFPVLAFLCPYGDGAVLDAEITDAQTRHFDWPDVTVIQDVAGEKKMPVMIVQPCRDFLYCVAGYCLALFFVETLAYWLDAVCGAARDLSFLYKIAAKHSQKVKVVVPGLCAVVAVNEDVVKERATEFLVKLVHVNYPVVPFYVLPQYLDV